MKNIVSHQSKVGYICNPDECENTNRCPFCGGYNATYDNIHHKLDFLREQYEWPCNDPPYYLYCSSCKTIYNHGCDYTDQNKYGHVFNAHLVGKYMFNGDTYIGMPYYENVDEWIEMSPKVTILEWVCPNEGKVDPKATYTEEERKEYCSCRLPKSI